MHWRERWLSLTIYAGRMTCQQLISQAARKHPRTVRSMGTRSGSHTGVRHGRHRLHCGRVGIQQAPTVAFTSLHVQAGETPLSTMFFATLPFSITSESAYIHWPPKPPVRALWSVVGHQPYDCPKVTNVLKTMREDPADDEQGYRAPDELVIVGILP